MYACFSQLHLPYEHKYDERIANATDAWYDDINYGHNIIDAGTWRFELQPKRVYSRYIWNIIVAMVMSQRRISRAKIAKKENNFTQLL